MPQTVLVVEDETKIRELLRSYLEREGFTVLTTASGAEAIGLVEHAAPDLIVLDLRLPDVPGEEVAREVRRSSAVPILMLTAKSAEDDRIHGLEVGADDYLTKPFSPRELVLRVHAILRRGRGDMLHAARRSFGGGELVIDEDRHEVVVRGRTVELTPTEWGLLGALAGVPGRVYSRYELINRVRGYEFEGYERTIDSHVKNLRRKIEADPGDPRSWPRCSVPATGSGWPVMASRVLGPLGARLALAFVAVALAAVAVLGGLTLWASRGEVAHLVDRQQDQDATEIVATLSLAYEQASGWKGADLSGAFALTASAQADLVVLDADGQLVATGSSSGMAEMMETMHGDTARMPAELAEPRRSAVEVEGATVGTAVLRFPAAGLPAPERQVRDALARTVLAGAGIAALVAVAAAVLVSRRVTRPVVVLTNAARRLEAGDRHARAGATAAPGELGELAGAFDQMADTLRRQDELRRTLVADVAHELRTPATILQGSCEELVDGLAEPTPARLSSLHDEVLRLGRVIDDLDALASAQAAGLHLQRIPVDLADIASRAATLLRPGFDDAGLTLSVVTNPVTVEGDPDRLHQITVNLLTNALKFTPRGGTVTLSVEPIEGLAELAVSDTGPGIPADEQPHVFERFWRGAGATGSAGSGIGLAVVAELVRAHGGRVTVDTTPGEGTSFTVLLPRG